VMFGASETILWGSPVSVIFRPKESLNVLPQSEPVHPRVRRKLISQPILFNLIIFYPEKPCTFRHVVDPAKRESEIDGSASSFVQKITNSKH
jgi:hypothetical protein